MRVAIAGALGGLLGGMLATRRANLLASLLLGAIGGISAAAVSPRLQPWKRFPVRGI